MTETELVKVALIRDDTPIGQPGRLHLNCPCGAKPDATEATEVTCACGRKYSAGGWLIAKATHG